MSIISASIYLLSLLYTVLNDCIETFDPRIQKSLFCSNNSKSRKHFNLIVTYL